MSWLQAVEMQNKYEVSFFAYFWITKSWPYDLSFSLQVSPKNRIGMLLVLYEFILRLPVDSLPSDI